MCAVRKQSLKIGSAILAAGLIFSGAAQGDDHEGSLQDGGTAGGVAVGDGAAGVTDRAWVTAPPNYFYVVEKERGSFLDCGEGRERRAADNDGRDMAPLRCGVTLTETMVIPAAASSARIIIHF